MNPNFLLITLDVLGIVVIKGVSAEHIKYGSTTINTPRPFDWMSLDYSLWITKCCCIWQLQHSFDIEPTKDTKSPVSESQ